MPSWLSGQNSSKKLYCRLLQAKCSSHALQLADVDGALTLSQALGNETLIISGRARRNHSWLECVTGIRSLQDADLCPQPIASQRWILNEVLDSKGYETGDRTHRERKDTRQET